MKGTKIFSDFFILVHNSMQNYSTKTLMAGHVCSIHLQDADMSFPIEYTNLYLDLVCHSVNVTVLDPFTLIYKVSSLLIFHKVYEYLCSMSLRYTMIYNTTISLKQKRQHIT